MKLMKTKTPKKTTAYKTISEVAKELNLISPKNGSIQTHTLRFWEKQFKQIKPLILAGRRRYYSQKNFKTIKLVKFLLKDQGLTIKGVRKILNNSKEDKLDDSMLLGVNSRDLNKSKVVKNKINKISKIIKEIKNLKNG